MVYQSPLFVPAARLVGIAWIIGGIMMILFGGSRALSGWGSQRWPHVAGKIIESQMLPIETSSGASAVCKVSIVYAYSPPSQDGFANAFQNSSITFRGFSEATRGNCFLEEARQLTHQYPLGKVVQVYYNPSKLEEAVLIPGEDFGTFSGILAGLISAFLGTLLLLFAHTFADKVMAAARRLFA